MSEEDVPGFNQATFDVQQPGGKKNLSKSATRALDVLEYFAMVGRPLRAVEIAQALGFHTSSTDQLLKTMVDSAYLLFDSNDKRYYPSPRLVNFGSWLSANYFGQDRICHLLQSVHQDSGDVVTLSIRYGAFMQIVDFIEPTARAGTIVKGSRLSITDSSVGTAFLSLYSEKEVIRIVDQINSETKKKLSVAELKSLLRRINHARSKGYVPAQTVAKGEPWGLAVPLPPPSSGMKMVLGIGGTKQSNQPRDLELIQIIRKNIERWLGLEV